VSESDRGFSTPRRLCTRPVNPEGTCREGDLCNPRVCQTPEVPVSNPADLEGKPGLLAPHAPLVLFYLFLELDLARRREVPRDRLGVAPLAG
jgi:hypothetical protein